MPSTSFLVNVLQRDFPQFTFTASDNFRWSTVEQRIFYISDPNKSSYLLHELAHGLLGHEHYDRDIQLLEMERDAWSYATNILSKRYSIQIGEEIVQDSLDSYRDWLHSRSTCPNCTATGIQANVKQYTCLACEGKWLVNDARACALRRYVIK